MDIITRRSFLGSLALGSIYPNVEQAAGAQLEAAEGRAHTNDIRWSIAKQSSVAKLNRVDFWSKPLGGIRYADELPSEIGAARCSMAKPPNCWRTQIWPALIRAIIRVSTAALASKV